MTALRALDYFNNIKDGKNCNEQGCKIDAKKLIVHLVIFGNFVELWISTSFTNSGCFSCRNSVDFVYNYSVGTIKILEKSYFKK